MGKLYFDYNASTPVAPEVLAAMEPYLRGHHGNPSSGHWASREAKAALERARAQVAALIGAEPDEIVFTSGGSEANNAALKGVVLRAVRQQQPPPTIVISTIEHPAVKAVAAWLADFGARVEELPVDAHGRVSPNAELPAGCLVSLMHANNEVGTMQPVAELAERAHAVGGWMHTDAAQSVGKVPVNVGALGVDMRSIAGHKLYAPKGIGALYLKRGLQIDPLIHGAGHESGRRAGTENVALAVAVGAACALAQKALGETDLSPLREHLWSLLSEAFGDRIQRNGHPDACLPNTLHVSFLGQRSSELLGALEGLAASAGSACHSGTHAMSPVLRAMGFSEERGLGAVRLSLGRETTRKHNEELVELLQEALR